MGCGMRVKLHLSGMHVEGKVLFLLGIITIFLAWIYSEILEYKNNSVLFKSLGPIVFTACPKRMTLFLHPV